MSRKNSLKFIFLGALLAFGLSLYGEGANLRKVADRNNSAATAERGSDTSGDLGYAGAEGASMGY